MSGYFGIGIFHGKTEQNLGTLWRSADQLGADLIFTIGARYKKQGSDTYKTWRRIPLYNYAYFDDLLAHAPYDCPIVAVEMGGTDLRDFHHPKRCIYILGAEDHGLPPEVVARCFGVVSLSASRQLSFNVAVAGAIVMYDRFVKGASEL